MSFQQSLGSRRRGILALNPALDAPKPQWPDFGPAT